MTLSAFVGAAPEDWAHFDLILGLCTELLPVVSNPHATISPSSSLKKLGKTPSLYNRSGQVVGIQDWTARRSSASDVERWSREPDYGICLQTRQVRAIDIDVPDASLSSTIVRRVAEKLGLTLPMRFRQDSGKCLLAFELEGELGKRDFACQGGVIEFLATGQQFIVAGRHPDGARYEWQGGLPMSFPALSLERFEDLWLTLVREFSLDGSANMVTPSQRKREPSVTMSDDIADFLKREGLVLATDRGALHIACPWDHEHSSGSPGDGSTSYFPAGTRGYDSGHFKCLHAHCSGRSDGDFLAKLGYEPDASNDFDVVNMIVTTPGVTTTSLPQPLPALTRDRNGKPQATIGNVLAILRRHDVTQMEIGFDRFRDELMWTVPGTTMWRAFKDTDYTVLRELMEGRGIGFKPIGREMIRDAVAKIGDENQFDSAELWLRSLQWDGVSRIERFLELYFDVDDSPYHRAVSMYLWSALAGRVLAPGCKADMVPVLIGRQGLRKSSAVAAMAPSLDCFTEVSLSDRDADLSRKMRGVLVAEIAELRGLNSRDLEWIKSFITSTHERWTPKYKEFETVFPRRLVFIATTNEEEFLADQTGNRRWLPVRVNVARVDEIATDMAQLWAEAAVMFSLLGVCWTDAERLSAEVHSEHMITDPWMHTIQDWLKVEDVAGEKPALRPFLQTHDVLHNALGMDIKGCGKREEMRAAACLRALGYQRETRRVSGKAAKVWVAPPSTSSDLTVVMQEAA